jgi:hypothetical protein
MRLRYYLLFGALALLLGPSTGFTQFGPPGGGAPGGGGPPPWMMDPNQMFNNASGGKDVIVIAEIADPRMQGMFNRMASRMGITNGQITRQQFTDSMQQMQQRFAGRGFGGAPGAPPVPAAAPAGTTPPASPGDMSPGAPPGQDGQWNGAPGMAAPEAPAPEVKKKPVVYRASNIPKELDWFKKLDSDNDGQVGLYEWKASGRSLDEFLKMDQNGDGFITIEEALRYQARNSVASAGAAPANGPGGTVAPAAGGFTPPGGQGIGPGGYGGGNRRRGGG